MHDGEQPGAQVGVFTKGVELAERPHEAVMHKVIDLLRVAQQRARVAPQRRHTGLHARHHACHRR
jgi:hypothetical protein